MYVKELTLSNFKSFSGSDNHFSFSPSINYLVGNNNAGKSTVLEAVNFMRNPPSDTETLRSANPEGDEFFVEMILAGDISKQIDMSNNTPQKAKTIKDCIYPDPSNDEELLAVRRYFKNDGDSKKITLRENGENEGNEPVFSNKTGIDAPFKSLFNPTLFGATENPETILDFSSTHILGKLVSMESKGFFQSEVWKDFEAAHDTAFNGQGGYKSQLNDLENKLTELTREQFGKQVSVSFEFDAPETGSFIKMGKTNVNDGIADTEFSAKGNGLQRSVAFALIRLYSEKIRLNDDDKSATRPGLFLCVDEPEIWMHPRAQLQLAQALSTIAKNEQVWVSTHSPYMLKNFNGTKSPCRLFIFKDVSNDEHISFIQRINDSEKLGVISPGEPSLAEITYKAFQIATPEYHSELFGIIQSKKNMDSLSHMDEMFVKEYSLERKYTRIDSRYLKVKSNNRHQCSPVATETLPVHLRNLIDHPESIQKKDECLNTFQSNPCEFPDCSTEAIKAQDNHIDAGQLEESIKCLENICLGMILNESNDDEN